MAVDGELSLQLSYPPPPCQQLSALRRRGPDFDPLVESFLSSPAVHRLLADAEVEREIPHPPAGGDQVKDTLPQLRRIRLSAHAVLL
jgi:hypothetical protein